MQTDQRSVGLVARAAIVEQLQNTLAAPDGFTTRLTAVDSDAVTSTDLQPACWLIDCGLGADSVRQAVDTIRTRRPAHTLLLVDDESVEAAAVVVREYGLATLPIDPAYLPLLPATLQAHLDGSESTGSFSPGGPLHAYRFIFQQANAAIFIRDLQGTYLFMNPAGAELAGLKPGDIIGRTNDEIDVFTDPLEHFQRHDTGVMASLQPHVYTETLIQEGQERTLLTLKFPYRSPGGELLGVAGISRDITEQQRVEDALRASEQRFKNIAENAPDMIFHWSYAQGFEYVSPASVEIIGYTPEEHYADPGLSYRSIHPDDLSVYESVFSDLADPEGPRRYCVVRWRHKDGHYVHVEMRMSPVFDEHGNLVAIDGIARDITQHVVTREQLRELSSRLTHAHEKERRHIARELHDEIGQALTIAKMRLRMIQNALAPEDDPAARFVVLSQLLDDVLQTVRDLSQELRPPLLDEIGWDAALASLCESFESRTGLPVSYQLKGPPERLPPQAELTAYRVVQEALTNIIRHAAASQATVQAQREPDALTIVIMDDGTGFDSSTLNRAGQGNTGVGLVGMRERVEHANGMLTIETAPGEGTQIRVTLPQEGNRT